jgi:hypothetical protein
VALIFGVAIIPSTLLGKWIGALGIFTGVLTIAAGVEVAYVGFASSMTGLYAISTIVYWIWVGILGVFMWRKNIPKMVRN